VFGNKNPIVLEAGCGKAEYTLALAQKNPERNYIGIDLKGARIWRGALNAREQKLTHVAFIKSGLEKLSDFFGKDEIAEIWIPFPDPYPKPSKHKKRLISPRFLALYRGIIRRGGIIHFKTDDNNLFDYALEVLKESQTEILAQTHNFYTSDILDSDNSIKTYYEGKWIEEGRTIKYLKFRFL
jgi:tRNA (guanine-N7-)-methyltransferase